MTNDSMVQQIAKWTALGALFLLPLTPLVVVNSYFFPFISGKAFYLRILIEIAVASWVVLALLNKAYRPRFSYIGVAVVAFVGWMFVADIFAVNAAKAFWSNFERMEGWVLLIHLLGFFFASSAVLRVTKAWRAWFLTSIGVSVIISGYALLQLAGTLAIHQGSTRIDASLGNSAYLAIYFLFSVCIALWLALTEQYAWLKWTLILLAALEVVLIFFTETRGTVIGLVLAGGLAAFLTALTASKRARTWAVGALALILVVVGSFYLARNSAFVQNNHVLQRVASISLNDGQTRFTIWGMAWQGALERPVLGWGQEGFNYVFNKYYNPTLYAQEQWFDRAHNAFIDWLMAGGFPALLFYLALFGTAVALLWRSSELSRAERIALTAVLVGYAVHNFFVFDNLYSYIYFFAVLALIDAQVARPVARLDEAPELSESLGAVYAPAIVIVACALLWYVNFQNMGVSEKLIQALNGSNDPMKSLAIFEDFAAHPNFAQQEIREQLVSFANAMIQSPSVPNDQKQRVATLLISEMRKQVATYPDDAREYMELSYAYRSIGDMPQAIEAVSKAIELSPKKEGFYIDRGTLNWGVGDVKAAEADFAQAYALGPQFSDLALYAAAGRIAVGDVSGSDKILAATFGTSNVDSDILTTAYSRMKMWPRLIAIYKARVAAPTATAETWFSLASVYYSTGDSASAIATINTAVARYPEAAASGAAAIKQIRTGK